MLLDTLKLTYPLAEKFKFELDSLGNNHKNNFGTVIKELMIRLIKTYFTYTLGKNLSTDLSA